MPRQMPRYGISRSRATRQARIFPSQPREPKPPGTSTPSTCSSSSRRFLERHPLGVDPAHAAPFAPWCAPACLSASCTERYASCSLHVLADERDLDDFVAPLDPLVQVEPLAEIRFGRRQAELLADEPVETFGLQPRGNEVDVGHVRARDHGVGLDVGEERDLVADVDGELLVRAADDDVGVNTDAPQLVDRVLRRLRLQLAGGLDERDERDVQVEHVLRADLAPELADRLEERQRLDVADRAADLADHDVGRRRDRARADARLISFVMCGITCTVAPRNSPLRSLRSTVSQIAPAVWLAARVRFSSMKRS